MFRLIPGLEQAEFARLGGLHRNIFLKPPRVLDACLRRKAAPRLRFAGQLTGCEGYVESAAIGLFADRFAAVRHDRDGLLNHVAGGHIEAIETGPRSFQPMNVNFGLFPPIEEPRVDKKANACAALKAAPRASAPSRRARRSIWRAGSRWKCICGAPKPDCSRRRSGARRERMLRLALRSEARRVPGVSGVVDGIVERSRASGA